MNRTPQWTSCSLIAFADHLLHHTPFSWSPFTPPTPRGKLKGKNSSLTEHYWSGKNWFFFFFPDLLTWWLETFVSEIHRNFVGMWSLVKFQNPQHSCMVFERIMSLLLYWTELMNILWCEAGNYSPAQPTATLGWCGFLLFPPWYS